MEGGRVILIGCTGLLSGARVAHGQAAARPPAVCVTHTQAVCVRHRQPPCPTPPRAGLRCPARGVRCSGTPVSAMVVGLVRKHVVPSRHLQPR